MPNSILVHAVRPYIYLMSNSSNDSNSIQNLNLFFVRKISFGSFVLRVTFPGMLFQGILPLGMLYYLFC